MRLEHFVITAYCEHVLFVVFPVSGMAVSGKSLLCSFESYPEVSQSSLENIVGVITSW